MSRIVSPEVQDSALPTITTWLPENQSDIVNEALRNSSLADVRYSTGRLMSTGDEWRLRLEVELEVSPEVGDRLISSMAGPGRSDTPEMEGGREDGSEGETLHD